MWWKDIFYLVNIFLGCHCKIWLLFFLVKNKLSYKKVDCQNSSSSELTQLEFEKKTCVFKDGQQLLFALLNTLLNIKWFNDQLCYCENKKECLICKIKRIYTDYEYDLYKNMFDLDFLIKSHSNFDQLFKIRKHSVWLILSNKYYYIRKIGLMEKVIMYLY